MSYLESHDVPDVSTRRDRNITYGLAGLVILVLIVAGLFAYRGHKDTQEASDKATQLTAAIQAAGYDAPDKDQIVGVLGSDGGALCQDPSSALTKSVFRGMLFNGAAGPGARPIVADDLVVKGQLLVISIYCPEELPDFQKFVDGLDFDDTVKQ